MNKKKKETKNKNIILVVIVFIAIFLIFLSTFFIWNYKYKGVVYPKTYIGNELVSGKTIDELTDYINKKSYNISNGGIVFASENGKEVSKKIEDVYDLGSSHSFIAFFPTESSKQAFDNNENKRFLGFLKHILSFGRKNSVDIIVDIDEVGLNFFIEENFPELIIPAENAYFYLEDNNNEDSLKIKREKIGIDINYEKIYTDLYFDLKRLSESKVIIKTISSYPDISVKSLEPLREDARHIIQNNRNLTLKFTNKQGKKDSLEIVSKDLISWIDINGDSNESVISLNTERVKAYLENNVASLVEKEIVLPKFEMNNDRVSDWKVGEDGHRLNISESADKIIDSFSNNELEIELIIETISVDSFVSENDFQIREIIGTGESNFQGSSANRVHNIKTGSNALHGLLIAPDEEFSILKALGAINAESGYRQELVIKDGRTIPEYGGGLCQVSTTLFRTVVQAGLPVTMRRNHSYRVSYYEPAGTDATIYNPWPDFKFKNDTGNYILIQSRFVGVNMYFDIWGLSDGRLVEIGEPVIYNIVSPPPTKYIETDELAPGEEKCTERSHNGADAYFDYVVTYKDGEDIVDVVETRFRSHYVPWQAVCLIGKEVKKEVPIEDIVVGSDEVSLDENINTNTE